MSSVPWHVPGDHESIPELIERVFGKIKTLIEPGRSMRMASHHKAETREVRADFEPVNVSKVMMKAATNWQPTTEVSEMDSEYLIVAEIPNVKQADVMVTFDLGILTLMGECKIGMLTVPDERTHHKEEQGKTFRRVERTYGSFVRCYQLPDDADGDSVKAVFEEGKLSATVAKDANHARKDISCFALSCKGMSSPVCHMEHGHVCAVKVLRRVMGNKDAGVTRKV